MKFLKWLVFIVVVTLLALAVINRVPFLRNIAGQGIAAGVAPEGFAGKLPGSTPAS
jgi:hypothetical protein